MSEETESMTIKCQTVAEVFQSQGVWSEHHESMPGFPGRVTVHHGEEWTVSAIVGDGAFEITVFKEHAPRDRALAYAKARYDRVEIREPIAA